MAAKPTASALAVGSVAASVRPLGEATRAKSRALAVFTRPVSRLARTTGELRLNDIAKVDGDVVDIDSLHRADLLPMSKTRAKVILSGSISRAVTVRGIGVTKGARAAIEAAGGKVED
jgi:ribosomal protein L15